MTACHEQEPGHGLARHHVQCLDRVNFIHIRIHEVEGYVDSEITRTLFCGIHHEWQGLAAMSEVNKGIGIHARTLGGDGAGRGRPSPSANTATGQAVVSVQHHHHQPQEQQHSESTRQHTQSVSGSQDQGAMEPSPSPPSSSSSVVGSSSHCQFADEDVAVFESQASILCYTTQSSLGRRNRCHVLAEVVSRADSYEKKTTDTFRHQ